MNQKMIRCMLNKSQYLLIEPRSSLSDSSQICLTFQNIPLHPFLVRTITERFHHANPFPKARLHTSRKTPTFKALLSRILGVILLIPRKLRQASADHADSPWKPARPPAMPPRLRGGTDDPWAAASDADHPAWLDRLPPEVAETVKKMSPAERQAWIEQRRAERAKREGSGN